MAHPGRQADLLILKPARAKKEEKKKKKEENNLSMFSTPMKVLHITLSINKSFMVQRI